MRFHELRPIGSTQQRKVDEIGATLKANAHPAATALTQIKWDNTL